jgi:folate-binding protein YgfZ
MFFIIRKGERQGFMTDTDYQVFNDFAGFYLISPAGYLRLSGPHQVEFLQRQITNDINFLAARGALFTALTSAAARLLDVFYLLPAAQAGEPAIDVVSLTGNGRGMAGYLKSRIFFMDRVSVADLSPDYAQLSLGGPQAREALAKAGVADPPGVGQGVVTSIAGVEARLVGQDPQIGFPYRLIVPTSGCEAVRSALLQGGAAGLSEDSFEILRLEAGLPRAAHELVEAYTPLELNLESAISEAKGCYTGQEVLARQRTYDKVTRKLVGLALEAPVTAGAEVLVEGRSVGNVTSAALSPRLGPLALAVLRRPHNEAGIQVQVKTEGQPVKGAVTSLPF